MQKIINIIVLIIVSVFTFNLITNADTCTYKEKNEYGAYSSNVNMGYSVIDEYEGTSCPQGEGECTYNTYSGFHFAIYINNLNDKIYATVTEDLNNTTTNYYYNTTNKGNIEIIQDYSDSRVNYSIVIKIKDGACAETILRRKTVVTPRFNPYSNYPICQGIEDFGLCNRFYDFEVSEDEFYSRTYDYLKKQEEKIEEDKNKNKDKSSVLNNIKDFIKDNYIYITSGTVVLIVAISIVVIKKRRDRLV